MESEKTTNCFSDMLREWSEMKMRESALKDWINMPIDDFIELMGSHRIQLTSVEEPSKVNDVIRDSYLLAIHHLRIATKILEESGLDPETLARVVHQCRRNIGLKHKKMHKPSGINAIFERNMEKYGDPLGPSFQYLLDRKKTYNEIIESALRPCEFEEYKKNI